MIGPRTQEQNGSPGSCGGHRGGFGIDQRGNEHLRRRSRGFNGFGAVSSRHENLPPGVGGGELPRAVSQIDAGAGKRINFAAKDRPRIVSRGGGFGIREIGECPHAGDAGRERRRDRGRRRSTSKTITVFPDRDRPSRCAGIRTTSTSMLVYTQRTGV